MELIEFFYSTAFTSNSESRQRKAKLSIELLAYVNTVKKMADQSKKTLGLEQWPELRIVLAKYADALNQNEFRLDMVSMEQSNLLNWLRKMKLGHLGKEKGEREGERERGEKEGPEIGGDPAKCSQSAEELMHWNIEGMHIEHLNLLTKEEKSEIGTLIRSEFVAYGQKKERRKLEQLPLHPNLNQNMENI